MHLNPDEPSFADKVVRDDFFETILKKGVEKGSPQQQWQWLRDFHF